MAGNPRVLVVDQDPDARADVQKGLARSRFIVVGGVGYGAEALSMAAELKPQVVLVGVEHPTARALQTIESLSELLAESPIIAYSRANDSESVRRAVLAGARDYLTKPVRAEDVIRAVEMALVQQERRKSLQTGGPGGEARSGGMILTVFGAKGGIGRTTIATNLATAFVTRSAGTAVLVDTDTIFGDVAMMMDVPAEASLVEAADRVSELDRETVSRYLVRHPSGLHILPAPFDPTDWRNVSPDAVGRVLTLLAQTHDFVVVDTPPTFTDLVAVALEKATVVLLITSLDITAVKGTTSALKLLDSSMLRQDRIKLIVNDATGVSSLVESDVSRVLGRDVFWSIPYDDEIGSSLQLGTPVVIDKPSSPVSRCIVEIASEFAGVQLAYPGLDGDVDIDAARSILRRLFKR